MSGNALPVFISTGGFFLALFVSVLLLVLPWGIRRANRVLALLMLAFRAERSVSAEFHP